jgi:hypothetical protein
MASRSNIIVVDGPSVRATRALQPRDKATFSFQFTNSEGQPIGSPTPAQVTIISVRSLASDMYVILYALGSDVRAIAYNAKKKRGVVKEQ